MLKLIENPPMLFPESATVPSLTGQWWVAHTKARNEKALAWDLVRVEVPYYLPLILRTSFSGGRKRRGLMPLFPSYVFIVGGEEQRHQTLQTGRVCQLISVPDQSQLIAELSTISRAIAAGATIDPVPFAEVGKLVRVSRGPFKNMIGKVIRRDNSLRLLLSVSILSQAAEMDIDADVLEPLE
jgi:transcription antitermination factor NusG